MMPSRRLRPALAFVFAAALPWLLAGCGENAAAGGSGGAGNAKGGKSGKGGGGAAPVLVGTVQRKNVPLIVDAIGSVEPLKQATLRSQVTGILHRIAIQEGQDVKEGDLLFEIDPRSFRNALQTAEADLTRLRVQLETASSQAKRYRNLPVAKEQIEKLADTARALEAEVQAGESKVANAKLQLEYSQIRAPFAGRTGNLNVDEGDLVRANDSGALVTINQVSPIYVTFGVPQQYLAAVNRARSERTLPVAAVPPGAGEAPETGELTFVDNTVDSATGTIRLKATFANTAHRLWPGQFAGVTLTLANPEVLPVAASAIQTSQSGQHVFVVSAERIAELRPVTVERTVDGVAVISKGLKEGETVVIDGQLRVVPGRAVEIKSPAGAKGPDSPKGKSKGGEAKEKKTSA